MGLAFRIAIDADGIATVWFDQPQKAVNTLGPDCLTELDEVVAKLTCTAPRGVIFASSKGRSFCAGADLVALRGMDGAAREQYMIQGQGVLGRIAQLPMPTVAAIDGDCLGGGLELGLACRGRVAADVGTINIGAPEVKLGLIPAWGGTVRLPKVVGLERAIELMTSGRAISPRQALELGLVDAVVPPEELLAAAKRYVIDGGGVQRRKSADVEYEAILEAAEAKARTAGHGQYPAPLRLIGVVRACCRQGEAAGFEAERRAFCDLIEGCTAKHLLRLFFLRRETRKWASQQVHAAGVEVTCAGVIGGGTMGAGIAHALIRQGVEVRLLETDAEAVASALGRVARLLDEEVAAHRLTTEEAGEAYGRLNASADWDELAPVQLAVEAVVEDLDTKRQVFAKLDVCTRAGTVLATNTSSFMATELAAATKRPQRVLGLHFFNPVGRMPLVEIVRTQQTDEDAVATALALVNRLGKTPLVIRDSPAFFVNRMLIPYLAEALVIASEGTSIEAIDQAMVRWGMPLGPFELMDLIGLDISLNMMSSLAARFSNRIIIPEGARQIAARGWMGKKSGQGFYSYRSKERPRPMNAEAAALLSAGRNHSTALMEDAVQWRLIVMMVNEAARTLAEGVTDIPEAIDVGTVLGLGLAPFRGGLASFIDSVGIEAMVGRLRDFSYRHGHRFTPADLLQELAHRHLTLAEFGQLRQWPFPAVKRPDLRGHAVHGTGS
jgi:3-hydroxyacyl-CoA dehydrogenase